ncbi:dihydroorotate dehydrogenase [Pyrobaculum neutrophilum]|uniref:Dihydroorotate dehydrogenase n=1 Tax=Pyrobaculum neutrophilum (strain DSM 2338 / JCM 9278 / NBRC 100436 / V24Sta) TaxID=444157 RepID=B1Y9W3_PYRNV|nr:dihydroorotate dehydrogenase [Pyrobaculum neutrophilum]ACB40513.1 dihydroorotate dehydrogenase [Pyrobaculum neutrophilum V24Sta]
MALLTFFGRLVHYVHPEISHRLGSLLFSLPLPPCRCRDSWEVGGVKTCGPVGVAAGLDKTGAYSRFLSFFCPGFIVVGSTLPRRRLGNKPPRVARVRPYSLVNAMGLNSPGIASVVSRLAGLNYPIFISLAGFSVEDFLVQLAYLRRYYKPAAVEVNISSPTYKGFWRNVPQLADVDLPVFVKVGPSTDVASVVRNVRRLGWGLVVTNTFPVEDGRISVGRGGLSGLLLYRHGYRLLERLREAAGGDVPIIYSGGVFTCRQLGEVLRLADAAEVLTSVLYFTPYILKALNRCVDR